MKTKFSLQAKACIMLLSAALALSGTLQGQTPQDAAQPQQALAYPQSAGAASAPVLQTPQPAAATLINAPPARKPGVLRLGVVKPTAQMAQGPAAGAPDVAESLRTLLDADLNGPLLEVVPISSVVPVQAEAEIRDKAVDYLLYTTLTQKKTDRGGFLKTMSVLAPLASMIPMVGGVASIGGAVASAAATTAISAAGGMGNVISVQGEVTLTYKLVAPGNETPVLSNTVKATAKSNGENFVASLLEQEATSVLGQLIQKKQ
jgi:hypothetical protein